MIEKWQLKVDARTSLCHIIAGGILVNAGIVVSAVWSGSIVGQSLQENTIIGQAAVRPSEL